MLTICDSHHIPTNRCVPGHRACRTHTGFFLGAGEARREARLYRLRGWLKLHCGDAAGAAEDASRALDATLNPADEAALWLRGRARAALAGGTTCF